MNVAGVIGGALPPLIAGTLRATYGSWTIGLMLAILVLTSLVCTYLLPETSGTALRTTPGVGLVTSVGVQVLVERDALTVAGHHLHRAGHRIAPEQ